MASKTPKRVGAGEDEAETDKKRVALDERKEERDAGFEIVFSQTTKRVKRTAKRRVW